MTRTGRPPNPPDLGALKGRLGAAVKTRRLKLRYSVEQCATAAAITIRTWYMLEAGQRCSWRTLPRVAEVLGCRVADLMD